MPNIPEGTFTACARSAVLTESGVKKTPQVAVEFEITSAEHAGQKITWYGFLTDKTVERTIEALRYAGWTGNELSDLSELSREDVPNVELVIEHEVYNGNTNAKVQWVNRLGGKASEALPADQAKALSAKLRGAIAKVDAKLKKDGISHDGPPV